MREKIDLFDALNTYMEKMSKEMEAKMKQPNTDEKDTADDPLCEHLKEISEKVVLIRECIFKNQINVASYNIGVLLANLESIIDNLEYPEGDEE